MESETVYVLQEPSFHRPEAVVESLFFTDQASLLGGINIYSDFRPADTKHRAWQVRRLGKLWSPRRVEGEMPSQHDFYLIGGSVPAFSEKAVGSLRDILVANGELLPLTTPKGTGSYWAYNLTTVADAIDEDRSLLDRYSDAGFVARSIQWYEFHADRLNGLFIFRLPNLPDTCHATEALARRVRDARLTGLNLIKVWPLQYGIDWRRPDRVAEPAAVQKGTSRRARATSKVKRSRWLTVTEQQELSDLIAQWETVCRFRAGDAPAEEVLHAIDQAVVEARALSEFGGEENLLDRASVLGVAWGEVLVRELGWRWEMLMLDTGEDVLAVVSPDRSIAASSLLYMKRLMKDADAAPTGELTYNMIREGGFDALPGALRLLT